MLVGIDDEVALVSALDGAAEGAGLELDGAVFDVHPLTPTAATTTPTSRMMTTRFTC